MRIEVRPPERVAAVEQPSAARRWLTAAMPIAYLLPGLLWHYGPTRDYAAASETIPLIGAAVSCYLMGRGTPGLVACLLMAT
jgi:hypothetical protein